MNKTKRALEVGMFTGCGALAIAEALPADGVVITCEWDPFMVEMARGLVDQSQHGKKVLIKPGICLNLQLSVVILHAYESVSRVIFT